MINYTHVGTQFQGIIVETTKRIELKNQQISNPIESDSFDRSDRRISFLKKKGIPVCNGEGGDFHVRVVSKANEEKTRQGRVKLYLDDEVEDLEAPS